MMVTWKAFNGRHTTTSQCIKGAEWKHKRLEVEETRESTVRTFQIYGRPLELVTPFKYLERIMTNLENNWTEVVGDLRKARKIWARLLIILGGGGPNTRVLGMFFKAVVQAVLIVGAETWVKTPLMGRALGGFQHSVA